MRWRGRRAGGGDIVVAQPDSEPAAAPKEQEHERGQGRRQLPQWLRGSTRAVLVALFAAGSLVSFIAAAGGAIIWVRFYAAQLPADQALAALPRGELIASGAVMLAIFVLLGIFAVIGVYMFDADEYQPLGMTRGLLALITTEGLVVVALAVGVEAERRIVAGESIVLFAMLLLLVMRWRDTGKRAARDSRTALYVIGGLVVAIYAAVGWLRLSGTGDWTDCIALLGVAILAVGLVLTWRWIDEGFPKIEPAKTGPARDETERAQRRRLGKLAFMVLTASSLAFASLVMAEGWIAVTLTAALALGVVSWRVAVRTRYDFFVCAIAVFASVPLIGAVAGIARNLVDPQVQPVALIRKDDGASEALQGIYVTETDDRIYFANVATEGCSGDVDSGSGRLLWVPRDEVVAMSLGPPQSVEDAGERALEMYYALAPAADPHPVADLRGETRRVAELERRDRRLEDLGPVLRRHFELGSVVTRERVDGRDRIAIEHRTAAEEQSDDDEVVLVGETEIDDERASWNAEERRLTFEGPAEVAGRVTVECDVPTPPVLESGAGSATR